MRTQADEGTDAPSLSAGAFAEADGHSVVRTTVLALPAAARVDQQRAQEYFKDVRAVCERGCGVDQASEGWYQYGVTRKGVP